MRGLLLSVLVMGLMLTAGCGAEPRSFANEISTPVAEHVFTVGYTRIADVYLDPVDMRTLTLDGIRGLSQIDPAIGIDPSNGGIALTVDGRAVWTIDPPAGNDAASWATVTARIVERGQAHSALLRRASAEDVYEAIFDAMLADLDAYSRYAGARRAVNERAQREGYGGVGLVVDRSGDRIVVKEAFRHGPAARAGIRDGDVILAVNGDRSAYMTLEDVQERLRGLPGSVVFVTVGRSDTEMERIIIRRERVIPNTVSITVEDGIGTIRIDRFNAATASNLRAAIDRIHQEMPRPVGFVLDLRGNPGGLLDQAVAVADLFVKQGRIISTQGRHPDSLQRFDATLDDIIDGLPMIVLVDGRTASASEIVAAALQDSGRAVVVGAASYGKGSVQTVTRLPNDGELFLTWSRIYAPSGYTLHRQGVLPTICTSVDDVEALIARLQDGRLSLPSMLASWRAAAPRDADALAHVRETCPWKEHDSDLDLKIARKLLGDSQLYRRALAVTQTVSTQSAAFDIGIQH